MHTMMENMKETCWMGRTSPLQGDLWYSLVVLLLYCAEGGPGLLLHTDVTQGFRARASSRCAAAAPTETGRILLVLLLDEYLLDISHLTGFPSDKRPYNIE